MMEPVVLISCMYLNTVDEVLALVKKTNIKGKCVVVTQCERDDLVTEGDITILFTRERGLSKSRNKAISLSPDNSICIFCDDDEVLADDYMENILETYVKKPDIDLIAFALTRNDLKKKKEYPSEPKELKFRQILKTSSQQITFKKSSLVKAGITVDEKMGSGTGNGGGEENKFMLDFKRKGLNLFYCPTIIATIMPGESQWFKGFTKEYIKNLGWSTRRAMGNIVGFAYIHYWVITHKSCYIQHQSILSTYGNIIRGFFSKR